MRNPCIDCVKKGCGAYHDKCPENIKYKEWRQLAATRRRLDAEVTDAVVAGKIRARGRKR